MQEVLELVAKNMKAIEALPPRERRPLTDDEALAKASRELFLEEYCPSEGKAKREKRGIYSHSHFQKG